MDSVTQFALGASVALATVGRRSKAKNALWKIALIGGVIGTLPDLDAFIDFGDAILNMIRHRAETHGVLILTLASPLLGVLVARFLGDRDPTGRWILAVWLILITHVGIDALTIYGTQLAQPFSDHAYGVGSLFVIDPLYTLPLLVGIAGTLVVRAAGRLKWNLGGLVLSTIYIGWSLMAHQHVSQIAKNHPPLQAPDLQILVTASPLNTVLWRAVAVTQDSYYEGWYSLRDAAPGFQWTKYPRDAYLMKQYSSREDIARLARFTHGFYKLEQADGRLFVTDLRLGLEPFYSFRFDLGPVGVTPLSPSQRVGVRPPLESGLPWLWQRMNGNPITLEAFRAR